MSDADKKIILLVEDDAVTARTGEKILEKSGYRVIHAYSGENAIDVFKINDGIDLILMDIDLGEGIDGPETAIQILKERSVPIVFLSSHTEPEMVEKTEKITSYGYVVKNTGITVLDASIKMAFKLFTANEKMKTAEETYRNIFLNAQVGLFRTDIKTGLVLDANDCLAKFAGYTDRTELLEDSFNLANHYVRNEDRENMISILKEHGHYSNLEVQFTRRDGTPKWIRYSGRVVPDKGWIEGVSEDITDRKQFEDGIKIKNEELEATNEELNATLEEFEATNEELIVTNEHLAESERALELSEKLYRSIFHLSPVMIGLSKLEDGRLIDANELYVETSGRPRDKVIGSTTVELGLWVDPSEREYVREELLKNGEYKNKEFSFRFKPGDEISASLQSASVVEISGTKYIIAITQDVSQRKKVETEIKIKNEELKAAMEEMEASNEELIASNEEMEATNEELIATMEELRIAEGKLRDKKLQMRIITDNLPALVSYVGADDLCYLFVNRVFADTFGMPPKLIIGKDVREILGEDAFNRALPGINRVCSGERVTYENLVPSNGELRWFSIDYIPEFDENGIVKNFIVLSFDITDRRRSEAEIIKKNEELEEANEELNSAIVEMEAANEELFAANDELYIKEKESKIARDEINSLLAEKELILREVHHRIKNNMNTISSLLTLQADTLKDPLAITALEDAGSRVHSMMVLYDKLYQSVDFEEISAISYFPSLVDEIVANFPNCKLVKVEKNIEDFILDVKRLQPLGIIINELLTNSMKYAIMNRSEGLISVSAKLIGNRVSFIIKDNGGGIPESIDFKNSSGFGLQLVSMLTEQIGGSIRLERGDGTKFVLEFEL